MYHIPLFEVYYGRNKPPANSDHVVHSYICYGLRSLEMCG